MIHVYHRACTRDGEGQYAMGIELGTKGFCREPVRRARVLIVLQPGEKRSSGVEVGILDGASAVQQFRQRVQ